MLSKLRANMVMSSGNLWNYSRQNRSVTVESVEISTSFSQTPDYLSLDLNLSFLIRRLSLCRDSLFSSIMLVALLKVAFWLTRKYDANRNVKTERPETSFIVQYLRNIWRPNWYRTCESLKKWGLKDFFEDKIFLIKEQRTMSKPRGLFDLQFRL